MAKRKKDPPEELDLATILPPVMHLPVRSLPFHIKWWTAARERYVELKKLGVGQTELAAWCGCAQTSVSNVLGEKQPTFWRTDYLERFSCALGIPLPLRAELEIETASVSDDEDDLAKIIDIIRWARGSKK